MSAISNSSSLPVATAAEEPSFKRAALVRSPSAKLFTIIKDPLTNKIGDIIARSARDHIPSSPSLGTRKVECTG